MYNESQKFTHWWWWALIIIGNLGIIVLMAEGTYQQLSGIEQFGENNLTNEQLLMLDMVVLLVIVLMLWIFATAHLEYSVSRDGIKYRFKPFIWNWKKINLHQIEKLEVNKLPFFFSMGLGYRPIPFYGIVIHIKGRYGLEIVYNKGKRLTLSCCHPEELARVVNELTIKNG